MKTLDIQAKTWFDKINGNSYFAGIVTIDYQLPTETTYHMPFQYGYRSQYEQEALNILKREGVIDSETTLYDLAEKQGVAIRSNNLKGCLKRDVVAYGKGDKQQ
jgi:hypothetical protein